MEKLDTVRIEPKGKKPDQLILLLHGYGQDGAYMMHKCGETLAGYFPKSLILAPSSPYRCKQFPDGFDWLRFDGPWIPKHKVEALKSMLAILREYLAEEIEIHGLSLQDVIIMGFSQGSRLGLELSTSLPSPIKGVVACFTSAQKPERFLVERVTKPRMRLIHCKGDPLIPYTECLYAEKKLKEEGYDVEIAILPGGGHRLSPEVVEAAVTFIQKFK